MNNNVAVDMNEYKSEKFQGINLNDDIVIRHSDKKKFARDYVKAYMKLLSSNIK